MGDDVEEGDDTEADDDRHQEVVVLEAVSSGAQLESGTSTEIKNKLLIFFEENFALKCLHECEILR